MQILEQLCISKKGKAELCEDGIFFNDHFAAVVDGCTSHVKLGTSKQSSGVIARKCILSTLDTLEGSETMHQAFSAMNASIHAWYESQGLVEEAFACPEKRCSAYVAMVSRKHRQVWVLGDCQALVGEQLFTRHKAIDTLMENVRALLIEHALLCGATEYELLANPQRIQLQLDGLMQLQPAFQNTTASMQFAYTVLDGFFTGYSSIQVVDLPAAATELVLASDGYPALFHTLAETEYALSEQLRKDPLMAISNRATKPLIVGNLSFDDRSFLRIIV